MSTINIDTKVRFLNPADEELAFLVTEMSIKKSRDEITECRLRLNIDYTTYQAIEEAELFNLVLGEPEQAAKRGFSPQRNIEIEIQLDSDVLLLLSSYVTTPQEAADYFLNHNQENVDSPLYATQNWFALHVTQQKVLPPDMEGELKVGYATRWA